MRRAYDTIVLVALLAVIVLAGLLFAVVPVNAQPAPAASAPAASAPAGPTITYSTECGAPGTGLDWDGKPVTRDPGLPGLRVDLNGRWDWCQMPPPPADCAAGKNGKYAWTVGANVCIGTGAPDYLPHGGVVSLLNQTGPLRGAVGLRCTDGKLNHVWESCAPATQCDTGWLSTDDGGRTIYRYDARQTGKQVPLGGYVYAVADNGAKQLLQCVDGAFQRAVEPEAPRPVEPPKPAVVQCGTQQVSAWVVYRFQRLQYAGLPVDVGSTVTVQGVTLTCGPDGKLTGPPPPDADPNNPFNKR